MSAAITRLTLALQQVKYPGYTFHFQHDVAEAYGNTLFLRASFLSEDVKTKRVERQFTRKWLLSEHMTNSELVLLCAQGQNTAGGRVDRRATQRVEGMAP